MKKIAVIGGGIAGLACARVLLARGHDVQVFDKGRGPGGRMSTRRAETALGEVSFDHGAQYFTARDPAFVDQCTQLIDMGAVAPWRGDLVRMGKDGTRGPLAGEAVFVGTPGMNAVVKALSTAIHVSWSTRVATLARAGGAWHLACETLSDLGIYDQIVCAVPAEQVAPLIAEMAPDFADQARAIRSLPCWTGMFGFERPLKLGLDAMRFDDHPILDFIADNGSKPARPALPSYVVQARADWSMAHLEVQPEIIAKCLEDALMGFTTEKPKAILATAHRWLYARVEAHDGLGHLWDGDLKMGLCGDWLLGPRVESAWLSGHQLGLAMTQSGQAGA